jgi:hypothetical protein
MRSTIARITLLLLLITAVSIRVHAVGSRDEMIASFEIDFAIKTLIKESGLAVKENPIRPPSVLSSAVYFQRPECAEPSIIVPFSLNYEVLPLLARIVPMQRYSHTFIYLDGNWSAQNRILTFVEWFKHATLDLADITRYLPVKTAVVLAEPALCQISAGVDWRLIWDRAWNKTHVQSERWSPRDKNGEPTRQSYVAS